MYLILLNSSQIFIIIFINVWESFKIDIGEKNWYTGLDTKTGPLSVYITK